MEILWKAVTIAPSRPLYDISWLNMVSSGCSGRVATMNPRVHDIVLGNSTWAYGQHSYARHVVCNNGGTYSTPFRYMISAHGQPDVPNHTEAMDCRLAIPTNPDAVKCQETLRRSEWERNFYKKSRARFPVPTLRPSCSVVEVNNKGDISHCDGDAIECEDETGSETSRHDVTVQEQDMFQLSKTIPRNRAGERVDPPITFNKDLRVKMRAEQWCSNHHLRGHCPIQGCHFRHGSLDDAGKNALLSLTRGNCCRNGQNCDEEDCYAGHQCPYDPCRKGKACHFPPDMHVTDRQIVNIKGSDPPKAPGHQQRRGRSRHKGSR